MKQLQSIKSTHSFITTVFIFALLFCLGSFNISNAQSPVLLKDINQSGDLNISGYPVTVNGKTVFMTNDGEHGWELWITDGTTAGTQLLKDINPNPGEDGVGGISPEAVSGKLVFSASSKSASSTTGVDFELWVTDGTVGGTKLLKGTSGNNPMISQPQQFVKAGSKVYYNYKGELWATNGKASGTLKLEDSGAPFCAYNDKLLYYKDDLVNGGQDLYITNGVPGNGALLIDGNVFASQPSVAPVVHNGLLYFVYDDWIHQDELWVTDGTQGGTHMVKDIITNTGGLSGTEIVGLTSYNGKIYFAADADGAGTNGLNYQPWVSDGTDAGTVLLKNINCIGEFKVFNDQLFFGGDNTLLNDFDLWVSDGTEPGTTVFKDFDNDPAFSASPSNFHVLGDKMYFTARTSEVPFDLKLFETDGSSSNTFVIDPSVVLNPNFILSYGLGVSNNNLYIMANYDQTIGYELYSIYGVSPTKWTGNVSTDWFDKRNWNNYEVPDLFIDIKIPAGKQRYPIITAGTAYCQKMTVETGASLTMTGGTLTVLGEITATDANVFNFNGGTIALFHGSNFPSGMVFNNLIIENFTDVVAYNIYKFPGSTIISGNCIIKGTSTNKNLPRIELFEEDVFALFKNFTITDGQIGLPYGTFPFPADPSKLPALLFWNSGTTTQKITVNNKPVAVFAGWPNLASNVVIQGANAKLYSNLEDVSMFNLEIAEDFDLAGKTISLLGKIIYVDDILSPFKITNSVPASGKITIENDPNIAYDAKDPIIKVDRLRTLIFHDFSFNPNAYVIVRLGDPLAVDTLIVDGGVFLDLMGQNLTIGKTTTNAGHLQVDWLGASVANGIISLLGNSSTPRYKLVAKDINNFTLNSPAGVELNNRSDLDVSNPYQNSIKLYGTAKLTKGNFDLKQTKIFLTSDVFNNDNSARIIETPGNTFTNSTNDNPPGNDFYIRKDTTINTACNNINVGGLGFFITCSNPINDIIISRAPLSTTGLNGGSSINRFYTIHNQGAGINLNAQIKIKYDDSELQGINESNLAIFRTSSNEPTGVWHEVLSTVNTTTNTITANGLSQLDYSTVVGEVIYYTLASKFIPLKSADAISNQSASNNTNVLVYPNPFISSLSAQFNAEVDEPAKLQLVDITGKVVHQEVVQLTNGNNDVKLQGMDKLPAGIYFMHLTSTSFNSIVKVLKN